MAGDVVFTTEGLRVAALGCDGAARPIVRGVDLEVRRGEVLSLIGESGSGEKTTALSSMGYAKPGLHFSGGKGHTQPGFLTGKGSARGGPPCTMTTPAQKGSP